MPRRRFALIALLALVLALASACGGGDDAATKSRGTDTGQSGEGEVTKGGSTASQGRPSVHGRIRSTGEYLGTAFALDSNLLLRNLVNYKHLGGAEGNESFPTSRPILARSRRTG